MFFEYMTDDEEFFLPQVSENPIEPRSKGGFDSNRMCYVKENLGNFDELINQKIKKRVKKNFNTK